MRPPCTILYLFPTCLMMIGAITAAANAQQAPAVDHVFAEQDGIVAGEAEHFVRQTKMNVRKFYLWANQGRRLTSAESVDAGATSTHATPDGDPSHLAGASGGAYLEVLPDTRRTHGDQLIRGENFSPQPGQLAVLDYLVHFQTPGRYYVWARAYSTGTEDNGIHVGVDGKWPETGQRMQWCKGKNSWRWESKQRTEKQHCGEPYKIYIDIDKPGEHTLHFSMREDGFEFDKWVLTQRRDFVPQGAGPTPAAFRGALPKAFTEIPAQNPAARKPAGARPRQADGDGTVSVTGEPKLWHKLTLNLQGPFAKERDDSPNPFLDYAMSVEFVHASGKRHVVPGYFAADGNAANTSADDGAVWRAHFAPDLPGTWSYRINFRRGKLAAVDESVKSRPVAPYDGTSGSLEVGQSDKEGRDLRAHGRLQYVGKRYLQFAGTQRFFLKAGADAPETLLAYRDFDGTQAGNPRKSPLKSWEPHRRDWRSGDPVWGSEQKGKGLIGAVNYLSQTGCNAFSFLTYNAGGDGDNVWPFAERDAKLHYDCSKLDQWEIVFEHATRQGMYLHFKLQETENDDNRRGKQDGHVSESLDGGDLGVTRKLYCRELIARFAHNLALNWNLGEENTQSTAQQKAMINYIAKLDTYGHNIVVHTYPDQQDKVYRPLLGNRSRLTGVSLQNSGLETTHSQTVKWVRLSEEAKKPWVVAFDESGSAAHGQCPDLGYRGFDGRDKSGEVVYTHHRVRKQTLWGVLMGGGAGCEYYFGYKFDENDLVCEDWRSRAQSWRDCHIAIQFFQNHVPFVEMDNADALVGNPKHEAGRYCFAKPGEVYVVYVPDVKSDVVLDLSDDSGAYGVMWFNPRTGGELAAGTIARVQAGAPVKLGLPLETRADVKDHPEATDWVAILSRRSQ